MAAATLGCEDPWLALGEQILNLAAWTGLGNTILTFKGLVSGREGFLDSEWAYISQPKMLTIAEIILMLEINEFGCYEAKIEESEKAGNPGHIWLEPLVLCH